MSNRANVRSRIHDTTIWILTNQFIHSVLFVTVFVYTGSAHGYLEPRMWPLFLHTLPVAGALFAFQCVYALLTRKSPEDRTTEVIVGRADTLPQIASHLAGHLVAHALFGQQPKIRILVSRGPQRKIKASISNPMIADAKTDLLAAIKLCFAGACAESLLHGQTTIHEMLDAAHAERLARTFLDSSIHWPGMHYLWYRQPINDLEAKVNAGTLDQFLSDMRNETMEFITRNGDVIREAAHYLETHVDALSADHCQSFITRARSDH